MVAHFVNERSVLTLVTVAGLPFTREELAAPRSGADPFTVRRLLCFRIIAARLISCGLLEDANARAAASAEASAALPLSVVEAGNALVERLEQLQSAGTRRAPSPPPPAPSMASVGSLLGSRVAAPAAPVELLSFPSSPLVGSSDMPVAPPVGLFGTLSLTPAGRSLVAAVGIESYQASKYESGLRDSYHIFTYIYLFIYLFIYFARKSAQQRGD